MKGLFYFIFFFTSSFYLLDILLSWVSAKHVRNIKEPLPNHPTAFSTSISSSPFRGFVSLDRCPSTSILQLSKMLLDSNRQLLKEILSSCLSVWTPCFLMYKGWRFAVTKLGLQNDKFPIH